MADPISDEVLEGTRLAPSIREKLSRRLEQALGERFMDKARRANMRRRSALLSQYRPIPLTLASAVGGFLAEPVRRKLVGRFASDPTSQGLGLVLVGGAASWLGTKVVPFLGPVGAAHVAYGTAILSVRLLFHKDDKPDPLYEAFKLTSDKWKEDQKKKENGK